MFEEPETPKLLIIRGFHALHMNPSWTLTKACDRRHGSHSTTPKTPQLRVDLTSSLKDCIVLSRLLQGL